MKSVLITGASRGIGRELALAFGKAGYAVCVNFHREKSKAEEVVQEIFERRSSSPAGAGGGSMDSPPTAGGNDVMAYECDVRDSLKVRQMIEAVIVRWKRLDVLVNNAGTTCDRTILKMTNGEWNEVIDTNLSGVFWCLREAARVMSQEKSGCILNIASVMGLKAGFGNVNYAAAKAGVIALTKGAARELGRFHIRVNAILPGYHRTDMAAGLSEELHQRVIDEHVLGRSTDVSDLAGMVLSVAENQSVSGQVFNIDSRII